MRRNPRPVATSIVCLFLLLAPACGKSETPPPQQAPAAAAVPTFRVAAIDLGKQVNADKRVAAPVTVFAPTDTIFASVVTEGVAPNVMLKARWTFEDGQLVNESSQTIAPRGPGAMEFHISKPSAWPAGKYKVEITANSAAAGMKEFEVR